MAIQLSEKDELLSNQLISEKKNTLRCFLSRAATFFVGALVGLYLIQTPAVTPYTNFLASVIAPVAPTTVNVFEITPDVTLPASAYVLNATIFNGTFSDGLTFDYEAPEFNFTGALLSLNFTNTALVEEKAAVAELTFGDIPVWRTSTPYAQASTITTSLTVQNVTELLSLFRGNETFTFSILEGEASDVSVELVLSLYNDSAAVAAKKPVSVEAIFNAEGPADVVFSLTNDGEPFKLPGEKFSVDLPQLESNVTVAKLSLFASATEEEITYYKNDIAKIGEPATNGPLRYINVYVNDIFVSSIAPKPTLFHPVEFTENANVSSLWQPLADTGAFEGISYEVELLPVLPLLWAGDAKLDIEVVSPVKSANKAPGLPPSLPHPVVLGEDEITAGTWFLSGKLLAWESPLVNSSVGAVLGGDSNQTETGVVTDVPVITPWQPQIKTQVALVKVKAGIISEFNLSLADATTLAYSVEFNTSTNAVLTKNSKTVKKTVGPPGSGLGSTTDTSKTFVLSAIKSNFAIVDTASALAVYTKNVSWAFPLTLEETGVVSNVPVKGSTSTSSVKSEISTDFKSKVNGLKAASYKVKEKLNLDDIVGASTDILLKIQNAGELPYSREVQATNGVIVKDLSK